MTKRARENDNEPSAKRMLPSFVKCSALKLGKGSYSVVYQGSMSPSMPLAVKRLFPPKHTYGPPDDWFPHIRESAFATSCTLAGIPNTMGCISLEVVKDRHVQLGFPKFTQCLETMLRAKATYCSVSLVAFLLYPVLQGYNALDDAWGGVFAHTDIKLDNMLLCTEARDNTLYATTCLSDFSCARAKYGPSEGCITTMTYRSPENLVLKRPRTDSADVWAMGISIMRLMGMYKCRRVDTPGDILDAIIRTIGVPDRGSVPGATETWTYEQSTLGRFETRNANETLCKDLLRRIMQWTPEDRPTMKQIMAHPFWNARYEVRVGELVSTCVHNEFLQQSVSAATHPFVATPLQGFEVDIPRQSALIEHHYLSVVATVQLTSQPVSDECLGILKGYAYTSQYIRIATRLYAAEFEQHPAIRLLAPTIQNIARLAYIFGASMFDRHLLGIVLPESIIVNAIPHVAPMMRLVTTQAIRQAQSTSGTSAKPSTQSEHTAKIASIVGSEKRRSTECS